MKNTCSFQQITWEGYTLHVIWKAREVFECSGIQSSVNLTISKFNFRTNHLVQNKLKTLFEKHFLGYNNYVIRFLVNIFKNLSKISELKNIKMYRMSHLMWHKIE